LETKTAKELFQSMAVSVFRFSAAQVRWSQAELDQLQSLWTQAYKRAEYLPNGTFAADMRRKAGTGADTDRQTKEVREKLEDLHQRWGRANVTPKSEDIKEQAGNEAKVTKRFIRIIQRKDLPWEKIPLRGQRMIPSTSQIAMFRLRLDNTSSFTSRFQKRQMDKATFE